MNTLLIFLLFANVIILKSLDYSEDSFIYNLPDDVSIKSKSIYPELLDSIYKTIYINDSIRPGYSITIDLSNELPNGYYLRKVSSIHTNNLYNNEINDKEWGSYIIDNHFIKFYLHSGFESKQLFILIDIYNNLITKIIELVVPVKRITFKECEFNGNYICNSGFEEYQFTSALDIYQPFHGCVNANGAIQSWFGSSSDLYGRNDFYRNSPNDNPYYILSKINHYKKFPYYISNNRFLEHIYYNPETWDNDVKNKGYIGIQAILRSFNEDFKESNNLDGESVYQNLIKPLDPQNKYVLEYFAFMNTHQSSDTKYLDVDDMLIYSSAYLSDFDPCSFKKYEEKMIITEDKLLIDKTLLQQNNWHHIKSKAFEVDKPMTWFWLGFANGPGLKDIFYNYGLKFDDVIIREAGAGITSYVNNYYPCLGDVVEYKFKIWKDDPEDLSDLEVHNKLPEGLEYIGGSFILDNDGVLKTIIKGEEFDTLGIAWLTMNLLVPNVDSLLGKEFTNEIYFPEMPEEYRPSVGKYKISVYAGRDLLDIAQEFNTAKCKGDTAEITITIKNISIEKIHDLLVTIFLVEGLDYMWKQVQIYDSTYNYWLDITRPELYLNGKIVNMFGYYAGQYIMNERNEIVLNSLYLEPSESLVIKLIGILNHSGTEIISKVTAHPLNQGCKTLKQDTFSVFKYVFNDDIFPADTMACKTLTLISPYPEYQNVWSTGSRATYLDVNESGKYKLEVTDNNGCKIVDSIYVHLHEEFDIRITKPIGYQYKGDTITVPVVFYFNNAIDNEKNIEIIFELDETNLEILEGNYFLTKIDSSGSKIKYRLYTRRTIPKNQVDKHIRVNIRFYIKNVQNLEYDINFQSAILNNYCQYLNSDEKIRLSYDSDNLIKISNYPLETDNFDILPNPFGDFLLVRFNLINPTDLSIQVNDLLGRQENIIDLSNIQKGIYEYRLDTRNYASGFYNICLVVNGEILCRKALKVD